jgi:lantibiotic modifying enzyme
MLLALVQALEGTDCHLENIVASGDQPVLVDAETLLHPRAAAVIARAEQTGAYALHPLLPAGIGYELLRLAYPDQVPSVLLWE